MSAQTFHYPFENPLPEHNWEEMADDVMLRLSKLRDRLIVRGFKTAADHMDEAIAEVLAACPEFVK